MPTATLTDAQLVRTLAFVYHVPLANLASGTGYSVGTVRRWLADTATMRAATRAVLEQMLDEATQAD